MEPVLEMVKMALLVIGGGVGVKLFEAFFLSKEKKADIDKGLRAELREELLYLRGELKLINVAYDKLKKEVLELIGDNKVKNVEISELQHKINRLLDGIIEKEKNIITTLIAHYLVFDRYQDTNDYLKKMNEIVEKIVKNREMHDKAN